MFLKTVDGFVVFATHFIHVTLTSGQRGNFHAHQIEKDGIVCYSQEEADLAVSKLKELNIPHTVETLSPDPALIAKAQGIKYASRTEAIEHLLHDKEPENLRLINLLKRLEKAEAELADAKKELSNVKSRLATAEARLSKQEVS